MDRDQINFARKERATRLREHYSKLSAVTRDFQIWMTQIEDLQNTYYRYVTEPLLASPETADEAEFDAIDIEHARQAAAIQAARERMSEALAHIENAILPGGRAGRLLDITEDDFK